MITVSELENGIRVVTEALPGSRSLAVGIMIRTGPRDQGPDQEGLAHLVEHALFQGTSSRSSLDIARMIDTMGGRVNAFTGRDYTCFSGLVMDDHRTYVFDLLSDILLNSIFPEDKLMKEKQVIISEQEMAADLPVEQALAGLKSTIWQNHPLGSKIEGSAESISRLTREDVIYFLHSNYLPDRVIVACAGNLEHEDIVAQVRDCFWRMTGSSVPLTYGSAHFNSGFVRHHHGGNHAYFAVGIEAPAYAWPERYCIHLLNTALGGGMSSRLYRTLREERGVVYDIHSEYHAYMDGGALVICGSCRPDRVFSVVDEIIEISGSLVTAAQPMAEEELWQAKLYTVGQYHIDSEDPYTRMSRLLTQLFYFSRVVGVEEIIAGLEGATTAAISRVSGDYFQSFSKKVAACVVGPD
ncbi:M16 family metallopeptidase [Desulfofustis limnaeus]|jgi:predicted Zn-dependent peptidase|uniref:Zinc protease n=1 Tax=Desulfofustis limnaeus TaxID=2740163 RepID=A0ABM7WEQ1_9BACT|nr:pitrilysin family protein [Desulfofustis limnaeus]MDX9894126.1 pitrilysin family protein [Desulfofustis sp.]BDD89432.1 putative zinc protease [Desulfofustis limnaeus]